MSIESELLTRLKADGALAALVVARIYPGLLPQKPTFPAVSYRRVSGVRVHNLDGASGRATPRFQFDSWAETKSGVLALATAVREALNGYIGVLTTLNVVIRIENEFDDYDEEIRKHRVIQDFIISHTE